MLSVQTKIFLGIFDRRHLSITLSSIGLPWISANIFLGNRDDSSLAGIARITEWSTLSIHLGWIYDPTIVVGFIFVKLIDLIGKGARRKYY